MSSRRFTALAGLALAAAGCGKSGEAAPAAIPRERFVSANVALRTAIDSTQASRDAILKDRGVTPKQLHDFVNAHARQPEFLAAVWLEVADSVDRIDARRQSAEMARRQGLPETDSAITIPPGPDPSTGALIIPPPPQRPSASGDPGPRVKEPVVAPDTGMRPVPQRRPAPPRDTRPWQPVNQPEMRPPAPTPTPPPPTPPSPER